MNRITERSGTIVQVALDRSRLPTRSSDDVGKSLAQPVAKHPRTGIVVLAELVCHQLELGPFI